MDNENTTKLNSFFTQINSLETYKQVLNQEKQIANQELQKLTSTQLSNPSHDIKSSISALQLRRDYLQNQCRNIDSRTDFYRHELLSASEFDTRKLIKYFAKVLTQKTGEIWLPIRFLISPATPNHKQIEAYGVLLGDAMHTIPNLGDTITLLDHNISLHKYSLQFMEPDSHDSVTYKNTENADNIWCFCSQNFICVSTNKTYNAFFDNNQVTNKPFLHLPLSSQGKKALASFGEDYKRYSKYDMPELPENHPRSICIDCLTDLIAKRMDKMVRQDDKTITNNTQQSAMQLT